MAKALGRAPSPYQPRARARAMNDNVPRRSLPRPANSNQRSFSLPNRMAKDIPKEALRRAVSKAVQRRALMLAARMGLRFVPFLGAALTLYDVLALLYRLLRMLGAQSGGKYAGYRKILDCGGDFLVHRSGVYTYPCGVYAGTWYRPNVPGEDATTKANIARRLLSAFDIVAKRGLGSALYQDGQVHSRYVREAGAFNLAPRPMFNSTAPWAMLDAVKQLDPVLGGQLQRLLVPPVAPDGLPREDNEPFRVRDGQRRVITVGPNGAVSIHRLPNRFPSSRPPGPREREKKVRTAGRTAAKIFQVLDHISERAEIVDSLWGSLPCAVQKASKDEFEKGLKDSGLGYRVFVDQAGQYGIDGADWKLKVIFRHFDEIDWVRALQLIAINEVEDQIIGVQSQHVRKVYKGPDNMLTKHSSMGLSEFLGGLVTQECK